jgi:DNA-binding NtrC family response regulator
MGDLVGHSVSEKFTLLFVDDEPGILSSLKRAFFEEDYLLQTASGADEALGIMAKMQVHAALIDLRMPGMDGLSLLKTIRDTFPWVMVIVLTGHGSIKDAVAAIQTGARDFIEKPFITESLVARVGQLARIWELKRENQQLKDEIGFRFKYEKMIGTSPNTLLLKKMISRVSPSDATVLIQGETGTGKELVAKAIHHHSSRAGHAFVVVDCATVSETMMESELFGHVKGAFTGAHQESKGLVRAAHQGTLFLMRSENSPCRSRQNCSG